MAASREVSGVVRNGRGAAHEAAIYRRRNREGLRIMIVATTYDLAGYVVTKHLGVVRGVTVRSRSVLGNLGGAIQSIFGGNITIYTQLAEHARQEAYDLMVEHAEQIGADAVIGMLYDANEIMDGITEVLAYGTAVKIQRA